MDRQRRLFAREVLAWFIVDELSLYRQVGSAAIMAAQMRHMMTVAAMPKVTMQVLPAVAHPATGSEIIIADESAYAEHAASGFACTGETVTALARTASGDGMVLVRDTTDRDGGTLAFTANAWRAFMADMKRRGGPGAA